jgi:hypothetical protein
MSDAPDAWGRRTGRVINQGESVETVMCTGGGARACELNSRISQISGWHGYRIGDVRYLAIRLGQMGE